MVPPSRLSVSSSSPKSTLIDVTPSQVTSLPNWLSFAVAQPLPGVITTWLSWT